MDNIDDFSEFVEEAKKHNSKNINVLRYKPSQTEVYADICLSTEKLIFLKDAIKNTKGISIKVDSAFSNLLCHIVNRTSFFSGCGAGRRFLALDAEGYYRPCSHIDMKEKSNSLKDVWYNSANLEKFRSVGEKVTEPCATCGYLNGCFGCKAIILGQENDFYSGDNSCPFKP
jgi:pyrroloquinoline quinone biosynthesis protein E